MKYPTIRVRANLEHINTFYQLGGAAWLRQTLESKQNELAAIQPTNGGAGQGDHCFTGGASRADGASFVTPDGAWRINIKKNI